jgi:translation initiation factor 1 (eIF-1/SUI1)
MVLFDADLADVSFVLGENSLTVQATGGKHTRKATIKRRVDSTRRKHMPTVRWGNLVMVDARRLAKMLRVVGCSALVKETKTEEEMRVNQVHFDSVSSSASSNARFHASVVKTEGMDLDVSIVGSDIPTVRTFCAKLEGKVGLCQDKHRLYVVDPQSDSAIVVSRVASVSTKFEAPTLEFATEILLSRENLIDGLDWALAALDGTQRLTCEASGEELKMSNSGEIFNMPVTFKSGREFKADLPAKFMRTVADHLDSDNIMLRFGHAQHPTLMEVSNVDEPDIQVRHFIHTMRSR